MHDEISLDDQHSYNQISIHCIVMMMIMMMMIIHDDFIIYYLSIVLNLKKKI